MNLDNIANIIQGGNVQKLHIPIPPTAFSYRAIVQKRGRKSWAQVMQSESYSEASEIVVNYLQSVEKAPGRIVGIIQQHCFPVPKSTSNKVLSQLASAGPIFTSVGRGDVHDNLNKLVPDAMQKAGWLENDSELVFSVSFKCRDIEAGIHVQVIMNDNLEILP